MPLAGITLNPSRIVVGAANTWRTAGQNMNAARLARITAG
ncbi:hypothetical protein SAMN05421854_110118 [Amycolatopsis rubida]|uniref:Uncharacterized protein n=1 Tax=Amycolatopsis rubida TaxID=112413 RepID=A0A1I5XAZ7_9PSEU|nr:hypothetical protein SAMN05421854_110118 [Amycolatopsis rubida]